uniref:Rab-like protein 3 n=2 Tax=Macrostomum lignano TaxID=282301 RepID=A0A1I8HXD8_9PLAT
SKNILATADFSKRRERADLASAVTEASILNRQTKTNSQSLSMRRRSCSHLLNRSSDKTVDKTASEKQCNYKVVALGNSGTGKTWLIERLMARQKQRPYKNYFSDSPLATNDVAESDGTIGVTVNLCKVRLIDNQGAAQAGCSKGGVGKTVLLHLWDTSGKPRYRNLICNYITDAHCVILAYNPAEGFEAAQRDLASWYSFVKEAKRKVSMTLGSDTAESLARMVGKQQAEQDLSALPIIVAISSGTCAYSLSETAQAGVNFGRVFASSVCGRFYIVQRPSSCLLPHRCQHQHGDCVQQLIRHRLTSQLLAEVLLHHQRSRQHRKQRQREQLEKAQSRQQSLLLLGGPDELGEDDDNRCKFWCRRIFGCQRKKGVKA